MGYLFHCVSAMPENKTIPANEQLIQAFTQGQLSGHLGLFTSLTQKWIKNLPETPTSNNREDLLYIGTNSMDKLYEYLASLLQQQEIWFASTNFLMMVVQEQILLHNTGLLLTYQASAAWANVSVLDCMVARYVSYD